ncbi:MAG: hypothetical protein WAK95_14060 [Desulfobacterales bacterium]
MFSCTVKSLALDSRTFFRKSTENKGDLWVHNNINKMTLPLSERRAIFKDDFDRENFIERLASLVPETQTTCFAWVLMPNHAHFLLRSGPRGIAQSGFTKITVQFPVSYSGIDGMYLFIKSVGKLIFHYLKIKAVLKV